MGLEDKGIAPKGTKPGIMNEIEFGKGGRARSNPMGSDLEEIFRRANINMKSNETQIIRGNKGQ